MSKRRCFVKGCSWSALTQPNPAVSLHQLPVTPVRRQKWLSYGGRKDALSKSPNYLLRNFKICSQHFKEDEFSICGPFRRVLKASALPSVVLNGSNPSPPELNGNHENEKISLHPTSSSNEANVIHLEELLQSSPQSIQILQYPGNIFLVSPRRCQKRSYDCVTPGDHSSPTEEADHAFGGEPAIAGSDMCKVRGREYATHAGNIYDAQHLPAAKDVLHASSSDVELSPIKRARFSPEPSITLAVPAQKESQAEKPGDIVAQPVPVDNSDTVTSVPKLKEMQTEEPASSSFTPDGVCGSKPSIPVPYPNEAITKRDSKKLGGFDTTPVRAGKSKKSQRQLNFTSPSTSGYSGPAQHPQSFCQLPGNIGWDATDETSPLNRDNDIPNLVTPEGESPNFIGLQESLQETIKNLRKQAKVKDQHICRLLKSQKKKQLRKVSCKLSPPEISEACAPLMSGPAHLLFAAQIQQAETPKNHRRWTAEMKSLALAIHCHSPKTYRYLRKFLILPCEETLTRFKRCLPVSPGLNETVLATLKKEVATWADHERVCTLILDEMSLKENLYYSVTEDKVRGYVDNGVRRKDKVANEALFAMVKGVTKTWKQALGFWLTADTEKSEDIIVAVKQCLDAMRGIGLTVKVLCTDQGSKNRGMATHFNVTADKPYFIYDGTKIFFMWDAPHLIKSIRNNLVTKPFLYNTGEVLWQHIVDTCNNNNPIAVRMTHKITQEHLAVGKHRKMKVKLATQIFSSSVYIAMLVLIALKKLPQEAEISAEFVNDLDRLFDTFNSMQLNENLLKFSYAITSNTKHIKFLNRMLRKLEGSRFLNCRAQPYCLKGWILNIRSLLLLVEDLKNFYNITKIRTRLLQTDALENSFAIVRQQQGPSKNPTSNELENSFKNMLFSSLPKLSRTSNCENDVEKFIVSIKNLTPPNLLPKKPEPIVITEKGVSGEGEEEDADAPDEVDVDALFEEDEEESSTLSELLKNVDIVEANAIYYVSGYFSFKFLKNHDCEFCTKILTVPKEAQASTRVYQTFTYMTARSEVFGGDFGNLAVPPDNVFEAFLRFEELFKDIYLGSCHAPKLATRIYDAFVASQHSIKLCTPKITEQYLRKVVRIRIQWSVRFQNRLLADSKTKAKQKKDKVDILTHK